MNPIVFDLRWPTVRRRGVVVPKEGWKDTELGPTILVFVVALVGRLGNVLKGGGARGGVAEVCKRRGGTIG